MATGETCLLCTCTLSEPLTLEEDPGCAAGLNSLVLASNNEMVILPVNEPTFGTPRKSQIQV